MNAFDQHLQHGYHGERNVALTIPGFHAAIFDMDGARNLLTKKHNFISL